jgi:hypothetical protein
MDWMGLEKILKKFELFGIQTHPIPLNPHGLRANRTSPKGAHFAKPYTLYVFFIPNIYAYFFVCAYNSSNERTMKLAKKRELNWTALVSIREEINRGFKRVDEGIHLVFCVVEVKTRTSTRVDAKGPMQDLRAVMPRPNRYAMLKTKRASKSTLNLPELTKVPISAISVETMLKSESRHIEKDQ